MDKIEQSIAKWETLVDTEEKENEMPNDGDLRVWWVPQVPGKAFYVYVPVDGLERAALVCDTLARYDRFQFESHVKPDYCNAGGLEVYEDGEWSDWYNEDGLDFDEWMGER